MRKTIVLCLTFALVLILLAGCSNSKQEPVSGITEAVPSAPNDTQIVYNIDELISAIAPGAQIQLAEGEYNLALAASYGQRTGNPYVKWENIYDSGYALLIHDVDNLTIMGSGKNNTRVIAQCPEADVLMLEDCTSIHLSDFTAGHTPQSDGCSAGVIYLYRTADTYFDRLGLFGCGSLGIRARQATAINITNCEIYDCSSAGIELSQCKSAIVSKSSFHNIGKNLNGFNAGYNVFGFYESDMVQIDGCTIEDNVTQYFLSAFNTQDLHLVGNSIADNAASQGMFMLSDSNTTIDSNNKFSDNSFSRWYALPWDSTGTQYAVNERGENIFTEDPEPVHNSSEPVETIPVITGEQKQVKVATVDEFLAAVDSNTEIVLTAPLYDLSTAADYGKPGQGSNYTWNEEFDGWELVIAGVENFSIVGAEDEVNHTISAVPRYADVIVFENCKNIMLRGFTAGHTVEPGYCAGGVLYFQYCSDAVVDMCNLYGCGIFGVTTYQGEHISIINSSIYECSLGGMMCMNTNYLTVGGCTFWDLGGDTFQLSDCSEVMIDGNKVSGTYYGN